MSGFAENQPDWQRVEIGGGSFYLQRSEIDPKTGVNSTFRRNLDGSRTRTDIHPDGIHTRRIAYDHLSGSLNTYSVTAINEDQKNGIDISEPISDLAKRIRTFDATLDHSDPQRVAKATYTLDKFTGCQTHTPYSYDLGKTYEDARHSSVQDSFKELIERYNQEGARIFYGLDDGIEDDNYIQELHIEEFKSLSANWSEEDQEEASTSTVNAIGAALNVIGGTGYAETHPELVEELGCRALSAINANYNMLPAETRYIQILNAIKFALDVVLAENQYKTESAADYIAEFLTIPSQKTLQFAISDPMGDNQFYTETVNYGQSVKYEEGVYTLEPNRDGNLVLAYQNLLRPQRNRRYGFPTRINTSSLVTAISTEELIGWEKVLEQARITAL